MKRHVGLLLTVLLLLAFVLPSAAQEEGPPHVGLRPDAPEYALRGPHWVGTTEFVIEPESARPIPVVVWYPALNPENAEESTSYSFEAKWTPAPETRLTYLGHALRDADPNTSDGPYPLVVFSHGTAGDPGMYAYVLEHLASYGFLIVAPSHSERLYFDGDTFKDFHIATVERPRDIARVIDYAESLSASNSVFAGVIDMEHVAVMGHSQGGYTSLAAAGARYDSAGFLRRCEAARAAGDPNAWLCDTLIPYEANMVELAGLASVPTDLWPNWGDPRVDTIITMAGDSYMFDQRGLAEVTIPVLAMGGTADTGTPYEWGVHPTYQYASSEEKTLVTFENAEHGVFATSCEDAPWMMDMGFYGFCADTVWDKDRAHDLINHFTTAFLLDVLKGDTAAHAALAPDAVSFAGISYEAEGF
jgi:predicted dienelactone hydrolase